VLLNGKFITIYTISLIASLVAVAEVNVCANDYHHFYLTYFELWPWFVCLDWHQTPTYTISFIASLAAIPKPNVYAQPSVMISIIPILLAVMTFVSYCKPIPCHPDLKQTSLTLFQNHSSIYLTTHSTLSLPFFNMQNYQHANISNPANGSINRQAMIQKQRDVSSPISFIF